MAVTRAGNGARRMLGRIFRSGELCSIAVVSYFPINILRIVVLRLWGAQVGSGCAVHHGLGVRAARKVRIGCDCWIDEGIRLDGRGGLDIGDHVSIGVGVQIWTAQHDWQSADFAYVTAPVRIGSRAWVNAGAIVLPGVAIGEGAVIGAGAVVTKDVGPWTLVAGIPAKCIGKRPIDLRYQLGARSDKMLWW